MQPVDTLTVHVVVDNTTDMLSSPSRPKHIASELRVLRDAGMTESRGRGALLGPPWALPSGVGALGWRDPHRALRCGPESLALRLMQRPARGAWGQTEFRGHGVSV